MIWDYVCEVPVYATWPFARDDNLPFPETLAHYMAFEAGRVVSFMEFLTQIIIIS